MSECVPFAFLKTAALKKREGCASTDQEADGREGDIELLPLGAEAGGGVDAELQAGPGHDGQEVGHHQLQALERRPDQRLPMVLRDGPDYRQHLHRTWGNGTTMKHEFSGRP